jgi:hypothetical protein
MNFSYKKYLWLAVVGALIIGAGTYLFLSNYLDRQEIIVAAKDINVGDFISGTDICIKTYLKSALPKNYLTKKSDLIGKVVMIDRKEDDPITNDIFEKTPSQSIVDSLKKEEVLLALNVSYTEPILDELQKGSTISIVSTEMDKDLANSFYYGNSSINEGLKDDNNENNYLNTDALQVSEKIVVVSSQIVIRNLEIVEIKKITNKEKNVISNNAKDIYYIYIKCSIKEAPLISRITKEDKYQIIVEKN